MDVVSLAGGVKLVGDVKSAKLESSNPASSKLAKDVSFDSGSVTSPVMLVNPSSIWFGDMVLEASSKAANVGVFWSSNDVDAGNASNMALGVSVSVLANGLGKLANTSGDNASVDG